MSRIGTARASALQVLRGGQGATEDGASDGPTGLPLLGEVLEQQPGVTADYVVLPRRLLADMPPPWQQQLGHLLAELHRTTQDAPWPVAYRVTALRRVALSDLGESDLRRLDLYADYDEVGELTYRHSRTSEPVTSPERRRVLVPDRDALASDLSQPVSSQ